MAKKKADEVGVVINFPLHRYRVKLDCPTPIGYPELEVEASNEKDAKERFMLRNGISDSEWPFTIERL